jgi:hypothetical protein
MVSYKSVRHYGRVSYWEWLKLSATALLLAFAMDAVLVAIWWFFIR